jgi:hypothetical protein
MTYSEEHGVNPPLPPVIETGEMISDLTDTPIVVTGLAPFYNYCIVPQSGICDQIIHCFIDFSNILGELSMARE